MAEVLPQLLHTTTHTTATTCYHTPKKDVVCVVCGSCGSTSSRGLK